MLPFIRGYFWYHGWLFPAEIKSLVLLPNAAHNFFPLAGLNFSKLRQDALDLLAISSFGKVCSQRQVNFSKALENLFLPGFRKIK
jgi:hypothetical protein